MKSRVIYKVRDFNKYAKEYTRIVFESFNVVMDKILAESQNRIPKDTWTAHNSADKYVQATNSFIKFFGGHGVKNLTNPKTKKKIQEYIVALHEDMTAPHRNGEAKFLSNAFKLLYKEVFQEIEKRKKGIRWML